MLKLYPILDRDREAMPTQAVRYLQDEADP